MVEQSQKIRVSERIWREEAFFYIATIPVLLVFSGLLLFPLVYELLIAFSNRAGELTLENILYVIGDPVYRMSLVRTVVYITIDIAIKFCLGLLTAAALRQQFRGKGFVMLLILLPWVVPLVPALYVWHTLYSPDWGVINYYLIRSGIISSPILFLGDSSIALYSIIWAHAWRYTPMWTLILLAGITAIPEELYESAKVDGASPMRTFTTITIPILRRYLLMNAVLSMIWTTGEFASVWVLTRGGPGTSTHIVGTYAYWYLMFIGNPNIAAAALVVALPIIIGLMIFFLWLVGRRD